jgi:hypothetical protein
MATNIQRARRGPTRDRCKQISGTKRDLVLQHMLSTAAPDLDQAIVDILVDALAQGVFGLIADQSVIAEAESKFDADSFSVLKLYRTGGPSLLRAKLEEIDNIENLRRVAIAQQISLPVALRSGPADAKSIRDAILKGAAKRLSDWESASQ